MLPAYPGGVPRSSWLPRQLVRLIQEDMVVCPASCGASALELLELFERLTGEPFFPVPGGLLKQRTASIGHVMGVIFASAAAENLIFDPPLQKGAFRGCLRYTRCPRVRGYVDAWLARTRMAEEPSARSLRPREVMAQEDAGLAAWITSHRYLQPVDVTAGESGMALR